MSRVERRALTVLKSIYATWHMCGLRRSERGLKKGRLCDVCLEHIEADMRLIFGEADK